MKSLVILCAIAFLAVGCNNSGKQTFTSEDGKESVTVDMKEVASATDDIEKKTEELKKLTPYTTDELKAFLPEELMGMKRTNFNASSMMGWGAADATYRSEDGKEIRLSLIDCAGEAGSGMYALSYWSKMSMQSENENGYMKTIDFNGHKAVESYQKGSDEYDLTYVASDRLLVSIKGNQVGLDAVKQAAQSLKLK